MKIQDAERIYHPTYISDKKAKPLLGKLSGSLEVSIFIGSIILAVIGFYFLTKVLQLAVLPSLTVGLLPLAVFAVLSQFVAGKPDGYITCWLESRRLEKNHSPLLSPTHSSDEK